MTILAGLLCAQRVYLGELLTRLAAPLRARRAARLARARLPTLLVVRGSVQRVR